MNDVRIIQSFACYNEGNPYLVRNTERKQKDNDFFKNFYTFLLSYLTIKKNAGSVTMVCNKKAYDSLLKYIPYDDFIILENKRNFEFWSLYKLDAINSIDEDVIHIDPDIMLFDKLLQPFIEDNNIDTILQHKVPPHKNYLDEFVARYEDILVEKNILDLKKYDRASICAGVLGIRDKHKKKYTEVTNLISENIENGEMVVINRNHSSVIVEELMWYLLINKQKLNVQYILPYELVKKYDEKIVGDMVKYTHLWLGTRFKDDILNLVKNKIKRSFSEKYYLVEKFEKDILKRNERNVLI